MKDQNLSKSKNLFNNLFYFILLIISTIACKPSTTQEKKKTETPLFQLVESSYSGVDFINKLTVTPEFNIFKYLYFYNGAGVACGDFNGDGLPDIYFTGNQVANKLYLNQGNLKFKDITEIAGVAGTTDSWKTGVTVADVNADGKLDIYVSQLGNYEGIFGKNQLFINQGNNPQGIPTFKDEAKKYQLDLVGFSTQAAFFDMDLDGDLDMYMLNHSVHSNGTFERRPKMRDTKHQLAGDKLMRNDGGVFVNVSEKAGIYSSALGYGLGISIGDLNNDGYPDIYIGNDFHENDYLYLNNQDGTFKEILQDAIRHTSRYSMGTDIGDINNDGLQDIISLDMLPEKYQILKASDAEDPFDVYHYKLQYGYNYQFSRNNLQLNLGNNKFSEIGMLSGIFATDWSWSSLFADFDLDGYQDIFISNGISRRSNDLDYIKYISNDAIQMRLAGQLTDKDMELIKQMPIIKIPNFLFKNVGNLRFENKAFVWGMDTPSFSSGAAYADLDNDGDLELVVNNADDKAFIYKNLTREKLSAKSNYLKIKLQGEGSNPFGIGARVMAYTSFGIINQEMYATRGFQSAVNLEWVLGMGEAKEIDSLTIIWGDRKYQTFQKVKTNQTLTIQQKNSIGKFQFPNEKPYNFDFEDVTDKYPITYTHKENKFVEFNREALIPQMSSTEGPALAVGDVNGDGKEDFFVGGAKWQSAQLWLQTGSGFEFKEIPAFRKDSTAEDVEAQWVDIDQDKDLDLIVLGGGNEFTYKSEPIRPRLYLNDGKGNLARNEKAFQNIYVNASALALEDFDKDGDIDVFIGGRVVPWKYGIAPESFLLVNDGKGNFKDITKTIPEFQYIGMVKSAVWGDLDKNGYPDLVVVGDWFPISIWMNQKGKLTKIDSKQSGLEFTNGFWNIVQVADIDQDGDLDIIAGNLGLNSKLKASQNEPLMLYVDDFDNNQQIDPLLFHYHQGERRLFATKDEIAKQLVSIKKKFTDYKSFASAKWEEIIEPEKLKKARALAIYELQSCIFLNEGNMQFKKQSLPTELQFSTFNDMWLQDFDQDGKQDMLAIGNFYDINIQMGRYDASYGSLLHNGGKGIFKILPNRQLNLWINGQTRKVRTIRVGNQQLFLIAKNNEPLQFFKLNQKSSNQ